MGILKSEAVEYVARAIRDGMVIYTDEMTAGQMHRAVGTGPGFKVHVDKDIRHGMPKGMYPFYDARDAALVVVNRYGRGKARLLVVDAYEHKGLEAPDYVRAKKKRRAR
jgi:hypothetical protein